MLYIAKLCRSFDFNNMRFGFIGYEVKLRWKKVFLVKLSLLCIPLSTKYVF